MNENNLLNNEISFLMAVLNWTLIESKIRSEQDVVAHIAAACTSEPPINDIRPELQNNLWNAVKRVIAKYEYHEGMEKLSNVIIGKIVDTGMYDRETLIQKIRLSHFKRGVNIEI